MKGTLVKIAAYVVALAFLGAGCDAAKKAARKQPVITNPPTDTKPATTTGETPTTPVGTVIPDDGTGVEQTDDVGEEVAPVNNTVVAIDTSAGAAIKHLVLESTDLQQDGRQLSEFLFIVRAEQKSCFRLKVRPGAGIEDEVDKAFIEKDVTGYAACAGRVAAGAADQKDNQDPNAPNNGAVAGNPGGQAPAAAPAAPAAPAAGNPLIDFSLLQFGGVEPQLALLAPTICSLRLFRMPFGEPLLVGDPHGIEKVVAKTGRLVAISPGQKVRVWLDDEVGNPCRDGVNPNNLGLTPFGSLQAAGVVNGDKDILRVEHYNNIAAEAERALNILSTTYGPISDIDKNGSLDVFVSPEVNRYSFVKFETASIDNFRSQLIYRPGDLARYNAQSNPSSNEGEIAYLWAPDPAGIYNLKIFPSANSVSSNYAKGYLASQIMTLIINNERLLVRKNPLPEDSWLVESLAMLASSYVAGNDYSFLSLANYLTSWSQQISLTEPIDKDMIEEEYVGIAYDEMLGLRTMFGWYLHSLACGTSVAPCAKLKDLIVAEKSGVPNIEAFTGKTFPKTLLHFGASVGVALTDDPAKVLAVFKNTPADKLGIDQPVGFPELTEVFPSGPNGPPTTVENTNDGTSIINPNIDRTVAGPFPSKDALLYQPILPDHDMDVLMNKNAVAYILVTGLIQKRTDITAVIGKGLTLQIVPIGERLPALRQIHVEKLSENAHGDQRPINLTSLQDVRTTFFADPTYPATSDYTVTPKRELWVMGSMDNHSIEENDAKKDIGDSDDYNVRVDPCAGSTDLATCQAATHDVILQYHVQDFDKHVKPMFLVTTPDRGLFRGRSHWARVTDLDPEFVLDQDDPTKIGILCQSESSFASITGGAATNCANGGLSAAQFLAEACLLPGACNAGYPRQAVTFSAANSLLKDALGNSFGFGAMYDNFFHSSPEGFPFYNHGRLQLNPRVEDRDFREYIPAESSRQFFQFGYNKDTKANSYYYYPVKRQANFNPELIALTEDQVRNLETVKRKIYSGAASGPPLASDDPFIGVCTGLGFTLDYCQDPIASVQLENEALDFLSDKRIVCRMQTLASICPGDFLLSTTPIDVGGGTLVTPKAWISADRYLPYYEALSTNILTTFYIPVEPDQTIHSSDFCAGMPGQETQQVCVVKEILAIGENDIRRQINVAAGQFRFGCSGTFGVDYQVCGDIFAANHELRPEDKFDFTAFGQPLSTDRVRARTIPIARRAGEVVGKRLRIHYVHLRVSGAAPTVINTLLGAREFSQGKYLLRVRVKNFQ